MPKDVNIHVKTTGADESRQELDKTAQAAKRMGDEVRDAGDNEIEYGGGPAINNYNHFGDVYNAVEPGVGGPRTPDALDY